MVRCPTVNGSRRSYASIRVSLVAVVVGALLAGVVSLSAQLSESSTPVADAKPLGPDIAIAASVTHQTADPAGNATTGTTAPPPPPTSATTTAVTTTTTTTSVAPTTTRTTTVTPTTTSAAPTTTPTTQPDQKAQVLAMVNNAREDAGCPDLHEDPRLDTSAQQHSSDMATRDYFSQVTPDGVTVDQRERSAGYTNPGNENIAEGQTSAQAAMHNWMHSAQYKYNILNCEYVAIGIGLDTRGWYWTQDFGQ